ncbi:hypothetical protein FRC01_005220 [Tulasnella sp. 417]|nr:hypothetical protein FRC01_005220 [Tulasnella sp. 417]
METASFAVDAAQSKTVDLSSGSLISILLITEAALLSQITVAIFLSYILFNALRNHFRPPPQPWRFIRRATDYYFLNLLFMDSLQALGSGLHIRWIYKQKVEGGTAFCSAQGFIKQFASNGVALTTLTIAVHTFAVLFLRWKVPDTKWVPLGVISLIWVFLILATSIPWATKDHFYDQTGYWCWISPRYGNLQYGLEYYIIWIAGKSSCFRSWGSSLDWKQRRIARQFLVYPIAYVVLITPISVVRKIHFTNSQKLANQGQGQIGKHGIDPALIGFAGVVYALLGFVDTILYLIIRPSTFRSFLSLFQGGGRGGAPQRGAETLPQVTVTGERSVDSGLADEAGSQGEPRYRAGMQSRRYYGGNDDGLPTVTVMSENHLMPDSLRTRGTVVDWSERDMQEGAPSSARTSHYTSSSQWREGSNSTAAERLI